ncbi:hypothetical protein SBA5_450074 [Candidatus Sulfotelmatomonas gaucii]|uniref:Uncharacterized protein n=1 Tax=Candidatus Sulfuritelmatomonas gaucii TaxID=2043161 RepID=A0A2N9LMX5_9BACT|nr:hypothetical protein SBA5_450074 [Candidatus Sulfotelmatomonas gaucii]
MSCPPASATGCMKGWNGNWKLQGLRSFHWLCPPCGYCRLVCAAPGANGLRFTMGCAQSSTPTSSRVKIAIATCALSERRCFFVISRCRHCDSGRERRCSIHASTARFTTEPTTASVSMGIRMASRWKESIGMAMPPAKSAASPIPRRMPLMVSTAVQKLCNSAIATLAPDKTLNPFVFSKWPPRQESSRQGFQQGSATATWTPMRNFRIFRSRNGRIPQQKFICQQRNSL